MIPSIVKTLGRKALDRIKRFGPPPDPLRFLMTPGGRRDWEKARAAAKGARVLIATGFGGFEQGVCLESLLGSRSRYGGPGSNFYCAMRRCGRVS